MKQFTVNKNDAGRRLDRFLLKVAPGLSAGALQKYLRKGRFRVNGKKAAGDARLLDGDTVQAYLNDYLFEERQGREREAALAEKVPKPEVVYEDGNILAVSKPRGLLSHSDSGFAYNTLIWRVQAYLHNRGEYDPAAENSFAPALANRIDRNTEGLVLAAKNGEALRVLNEKIRLREIDKYYLAAVVGTGMPKRGTLSGHLFKDAKQNRVFVTDKPQRGSVSAETEYRVVSENSAQGLTLLECRLKTGRTHQIRAQLAHAGFPILGDGKYGSGEANRRFHEPQQLLTSYRLVFSFAGDAGSLEYLNGKTVELQTVDFAEKYFGAGKKHR
ncbi:MAG: RluA family pseudouridine synthase [Oscillospiraceae bacterium]|jgi:23S rRNA pseudouridine955/2504/2580 synthase|nr:RluA family pseudouridine synthase [Oscillospiraceae bacterium]